MKPAEISHNDKNSIYFVSDLHLGLPDIETSHNRERLFVQWLSSIESQCDALCIVGDLFDVWFEYKRVVPRGHVRVLGALARLSDKGIPIYFFKGNHDAWLRGYLEEEIGAMVIDDYQVFSYRGRLAYVAHGDGKGPEDFGYKRLKKVFRNPFLFRLFSLIHPNLGLRMATRFSRGSRKKQEQLRLSPKTVEARIHWHVQYCEQKQKEFPVDFYVMGHHHFSTTHPIANNAMYINLGAWFDHPFCGIWNDTGLALSPVGQ